jgi:Na+(H+)/acetate symporter ActP
MALSTRAVLRWEDAGGYGNKTTFKGDASMTAAKIKTFMTAVIAHSNASLLTYKLENPEITDLMAAAVDAQFNHVKDQIRLKFNVIEVADGDMTTKILTIPAPKVASLDDSEGSWVFDVTSGGTLATALATCAGWSSVTFSGSKFVSKIVKD